MGRRDDGERRGEVEGEEVKGLCVCVCAARCGWR